MATIGTGRYLADSADFREGAFRFGQTISYEKLREHYYRSDTMHFLCYGLIEEAMKGVEICDIETGEALDWNDEFQEYFIQDRPELIRALAMERRDGRALAAFLKKNNKKLIFRSFTQDFYGVDYNEYGEAERIDAQSRIHLYPSDVSHIFEGKQLDTAKELIFRRREKVNSGMSYMEPVWDIDIALYFVASHIAYYIAKNGGGIKAFKQTDNDNVPVDPLDANAIDDLIEAAANFGGANDIMWIPAGVELITELMTSGGQVRWMEVFDVLLARLSIYTGVPASRLKGLVPGQLEGAEVNEASYFDVLRDLQEQIKPFLKWYVMTIVEFYGLPTDEFDIGFNVREELSEDDQITRDMKRVDLAQKYISVGFKRNEAISRAGIEFSTGDLEEEELLIEDEEIQNNKSKKEPFLTVKNGKE